MDEKTMIYFIKDLHNTQKAIMKFFNDSAPRFMTNNPKFSEIKDQIEKRQIKIDELGGK